MILKMQDGSNNFPPHGWMKKTMKYWGKWKGNECCRLEEAVG